jgi:hypothetical protein
MFQLSINPSQASQLTTWGPVIVSTASIVAVVIAQFWTGKRDREARSHDAKQKQVYRWEEFQLKTLLELQQVLRRVASLPGRIVAAYDPNIVGSNVTDAGERDVEYVALKEQLFDTAPHVLALSVCIADERLSRLVHDLLDDATTSIQAKNAKDHKAATAKLLSAFVVSNERIGELIHALRPHPISPSPSPRSAPGTPSAGASAASPSPAP